MHKKTQLTLEEKFLKESLGGRKIRWFQRCQFYFREQQLGYKVRDDVWETLIKVGQEYDRISISYPVTWARLHEMAGKVPDSNKEIDGP